MARKDFQRFKVGDIICPQPNRRASADYGITKLISAKVIGITNNYSYGNNNTSQHLQLCIIEGFVGNYLGIHKKGERFVGFNDAYMIKEDTNYEIF